MRIIIAIYHGTHIYTSDPEGKAKISNDRWFKYLDALAIINEVEADIDMQYAKINLDTSDKPSKV